MTVTGSLPGDSACAQLSSIAQVMRTALLAAMRAAALPEDVGGACALGSFLLCDAVRRFTGMTAWVRGGSGDGEGVLDPEGIWRGHYWVEAQPDDASEPILVDNTSDQFGWPAIVCERRTALAGRYRPGEQALVDAHMAAVLRWIESGGADLAGPAPAI